MPNILGNLVEVLQHAVEPDVEATANLLAVDVRAYLARITGPSISIVSPLSGERRKRRGRKGGRAS